MSSNNNETSLFSNAEIIHSYTRKDALEDGFLVDVSNIAQEANFNYPVTLTREVWEDCVEWNEKDSKRHKTHQDLEGRLWDVVWMASLAARSGGTSVLYKLCRVPRKGRGRNARLVVLKMVVGPGDNGEMVITIMQPNQD